MFKLQRYFSLASAVAIALLTIMLAYLDRQNAVIILSKLIEDQNVVLSRSFANVIWPKYAEYVKAVPEVDGDALRARPETKDIHTTLKTLTSGLPVLKVKMYNLEGLTVYSSEFSQIGASKKGNIGFESTVRLGVPSTKSSFRETFRSFDGLVTNRHLIESYLPIRGADGRVEGIFELYADVTPQIAKIKSSTTTVVVYLLIGLGLLYGVLFFIVRHADRILKHQYIDLEHEIGERKRTEDELRDSEERLKSQVIDLRDSEERMEAQARELVAMTEDLHAVKEEMQFLANHDALTGLPSLRLFKDRLENALAGEKRNKTQTAVLFIDLDRFKAVNDAMGHEAGDMVLKGVAERLKNTIREVDTAARIGGDEFILVLPNAGQKDDIANVAQKIINILSEPYPVNGEVAHVGASIGIAISPGDGDTADLLLQSADKSMYAIKHSGKNSYGFCS